MKFSTTALVLLFSFGAQATSTYLIATEAYVNGQLIGRPKVTVVDGMRATVSQTGEGHDLRTSVLPEKTENGILLNFEISYAGKAGKPLKSTPMLLVKSGEPASITIGAVGGKEELKLKVVAIEEIARRAQGASLENSEVAPDSISR